MEVDKVADELGIDDLASIRCWPILAWNNPGLSGRRQSPRSCRGSAANASRVDLLGGTLHQQRNVHQHDVLSRDAASLIIAKMPMASLNVGNHEQCGSIRGHSRCVVLRSACMLTTWTIILHRTGEFGRPEHRRRPAEFQCTDHARVPERFVAPGHPALNRCAAKPYCSISSKKSAPSAPPSWPAIMATAKKYQGEPIFFVAVNSGTSKPSIKQSAVRTGVDWPIIVDMDRAFGTGVWRVADLTEKRNAESDPSTPKVNWKLADWGDAKAPSFACPQQDQPLELQAKDVPPELYQVWLSVELGQFSDAGRGSKWYRTTGNADFKDATRKLADYVNGRIRHELDKAKTELETSKYRAYQHYATIAEQYAGYAATKEAVTAQRELTAIPR